MQEGPYQLLQTHINIKGLSFHWGWGGGAEQHGNLRSMPGQTQI